MINKELFKSGGRRWVYMGRDPSKGENLIDTNTYLITDGDSGMLVDPGGMETFPSVVAAVSKEIAIENIEKLFASHQDPDIISSLSLWMGMSDNLEVLASWVWGLFIPHFGGGEALVTIPDEGGTVRLGDSNDIQIVPAHYLHSSGNFSLYDPKAKILFSGDIGAALLPNNQTDIFVTDFQSHTQYMEAFHRRWMPSNRAKDKWIQAVSKLDIELMCPQHGSIFQGEDVQRFLNWFSELEVGSAV